jgi:hypothetical protein
LELRIEKQRKTAAEQLTFRCYFGCEIVGSLGFLRQTRSGSLLICGKDSGNSEKRRAVRQRDPIRTAMRPGDSQRSRLTYGSMVQC